MNKEDRLEALKSVEIVKPREVFKFTYDQNLFNHPMNIWGETEVTCLEESPRIRTIKATYVKEGMYSIALPYVQFYFNQDACNRRSLQVTFSQKPVGGLSADKVFFPPLPHVHDKYVCGVSGLTIEDQIVSFWNSGFCFDEGYQGTVYCNRYLGGIDGWARRTEKDPTFILRDTFSISSDIMKSYCKGSYKDRKRYER